MPKQSWTRILAFHQRRAAEIASRIAKRKDTEAHADAGLIHATLAVAATQHGILLELRRIRRALERAFNPDTVRLNLTGSIVPKHGGYAMPGPFNPAEDQDVELTINPVNAAGLPTSGPFNWGLSDGAMGTLVVADDQKAARLVTNPGAFTGVVIVTDPRTSVTGSAEVTRTVTPPPPPPPDDNNTVAMNLDGRLVPKVPA